MKGGLRSVREVPWFPRFGRPSVYLASLVATPLALTLAVTQPVDVPEPLYGASVFLAALPIYFMTRASSFAVGRSPYSWWGLRAQTWLHLGGAAGAAVRGFDDRPTPPRHAAGPER